MTTFTSPPNNVLTAGAWVAVENVFSSDNQRATLTTAGSSAFEVNGFQFQDVPLNSTINSLTAELEHHESATTTTLELQLYDGATLIGGPASVTTTTTVDTVVFPVLGTPTAAQLRSANLKLMVTGAKNGGGGSRTFNIDRLALVADYTAPVLITSSDAGTGTEVAAAPAAQVAASDSGTATVENATAMEVVVSKADSDSGTSLETSVVTVTSVRVTLELWENGLKLIDLGEYDYGPTEDTFEVTWDASLLSDTVGAGVELRLAGGAQFDVDGIAWDARYLQAATGMQEFLEDDSGAGLDAHSLTARFSQAESGTSDEDQVLVQKYRQSDSAMAMDQHIALDKTISEQDTGFSIELEYVEKPPKGYIDTRPLSLAGRASFDLQ